MRSNLQEAKEPAELGESTRSVLTWLGASEEEIATMIERGAVKVNR